MVDGYEGGVKDITLGHVALHEVLLNYRSTGDLMSEHERVEDWCDPDDLVRCKRVSTVIVSRWQRDLPVKVAQ